jgi:hypothetical protein
MPPKGSSISSKIGSREARKGRRQKKSVYPLTPDAYLLTDRVFNILISKFL